MSVLTRSRSQSSRPTHPATAKPVVRRGLSATGFGVATAFHCLSQTPSLLPRDWLLQGVISGITAAMGYTAGAAIGAFFPPPRRRTWWILLTVAAAAVSWFLAEGYRWQSELRDRLAMAPPQTTYAFRIVSISVLTFALLLLIARTLRLATRTLGALLRRIAPPLLASTTAMLLVLLLAASFVDRLLVANAYAAAGRNASIVNAGTDSAAVAPTSSLRSGGPYSLVSWQSLGRQGRDFVGTGPTRAQLTAFTATRTPPFAGPALPVPAPSPAAPSSRGVAFGPIRVYAGLDSAATAQERARLVVAEMDRTGAWDRSVIAVLVPTGTGWVDKKVADSLEYLYSGDTALASMQYSYLPSWLSFLAEQDKAIDAARILITAVQQRWAALPPNDRPKLLIFGESLGTLGIEKTFGTAAAMVTGADGILLEGPTFANPVRNALIRARQPGTPVWNPVYRGLPVAFASRPDELRALPDRPAAVYLQNSSDPIVWWSPYLLIHKPDWLRGERGPDVSPDMHWYPGITFWQCTVDLAFAKSSPAGRGHVYGSGVVDGWVALTRPPGWTTADTLRLRTLLDS